MKHLFKAPAFQLYAKEFLQDEAVIAMDLEGVGAYIILLCHQWNEGSVPADVSLMARICRTTPERMEKIWPQIAPKFSALRPDKNRLVNPKLEIIRNEKMRFSLKQADSGERGAQKRWNNRPHDDNGLNRVAHASAIGSRWASDGSGSGSVNTPPTPSQERAVGVDPSDPDELPFATPLDPLLEAQNKHSHFASAARNVSGLAPAISDAIQQTAARIHARHPRARRDIGVEQVGKKLVAIVKHRRVPIQEQPALLEQLDRTHAAICASEAWSKDGGQFAKSLENWLAPTKERYLAEPAPSTSGVGYRDMDDWKKGIVQ